MISTAMRERRDGPAAGAREAAGRTGQPPGRTRPVSSGAGSRESGAAASHNVIQRPRKRKAFDAASRRRAPTAATRHSRGRAQTGYHRRQSAQRQQTQERSAGALVLLGVELDFRELVGIEAHRDWLRSAIMLSIWDCIECAHGISFVYVT